MIRSFLFASLLMVTGLVLADEVPASSVPDTAAEKRAEAAASSGQSDEGRPESEVTDAEQRTDGGPKRISGMSVLGNQEAPKSLTIVPWKSSEIGDSVGISTMLDDSRQPVDREVFLRALSYYELQSGDRVGAAGNDGDSPRK